MLNTPDCRTCGHHVHAEGVGGIGPLEATSALKARRSLWRPLSRRAAGPRAALGILVGAPASC